MSPTPRLLPAIGSPLLRHETSEARDADWRDKARAFLMHSLKS